MKRTRPEKIDIDIYCAMIDKSMSVTELCKLLDIQRPQILNSIMRMLDKNIIEKADIKSKEMIYKSKKPKAKIDNSKWFEFPVHPPFPYLTRYIGFEDGSD